MNVRLSSIQRFCVHDGPGIRTTVFLKGCGCHCPWCSNPENIRSGREYFVMADRCIMKDGGCEINLACSVLRKKMPDGADAENCTVGAVSCYGKEMGTEELLHQLLKDRNFYAGSGGVTFSGGEVLLQAAALKELMRRLKEEKIHICVETSLFAPTAHVRDLLPYIDLFIVDLKIMDPSRCRDVLGGDMDLYRQNLELLFAHPGKRVVARVPLVKGYTFTDENLGSISGLLKRYPFERCEIFSVHNLGAAKYRTLGLEYTEFEVLTEEELEHAAGLLEPSGIPVRIIRL